MTRLMILVFMCLVVIQIPVATAQEDSAVTDGADVVGEIALDETEVPESEEFALPEELNDPAFERYIDIALLAAAVESLDASALTDAGLQLAEGERVLGRSHNAVPADQILLLAVRAAADSKDQVALTRLTKVAEALDKKMIAGAVASAKTLAGESRAVIPESMIPPDELTSDDFILLRSYLDDIRRARLLNDSKAIEDLESEMKQRTGLPADRIKYLLLVAANAETAMSESDSDDNAALWILSAASRGWPIIKIPRPPQPRMPQYPAVMKRCPCCNGSGMVSYSTYLNYLRSRSQDNPSMPQRPIDPRKLQRLRLPGGFGSN